MTRFNSKPKTFNSKVASEETNDPDDFLGIEHDRATGHIYHTEDPNQSFMRRSVKAAANHELYGCGKRCRSGCTGGYKDRGQSEPPVINQRLFGLKKNADGNWIHSPNMAQLNNPKTLTDYLNIPVVSKTFVKEQKNDNNAQRVPTTVADYFYAPEKVITRDRKGNNISAGQYFDETGRAKFGHPMQKIGLIHTLRDAVYTRLVNEGSTDPKDYYKAQKIVTHFAHGHKADASSTSRWTSLRPGAKPVAVEKEIKGVLGSIVSNVVPDSPVQKDPVHTEAVKEMHRGLLKEASNAEFVGCHCVHDALNHTANPTNSYIDIQHHNEAASNPDSKDSYFAGFPMGHSFGLGEGKEGRISELGDWGKRTPHRAWLTGKSPLKFIKAAVHGKNNENNVSFPGNETMLSESGLGSLGIEDLGEDIEPFFKKKDDYRPDITPDSAERAKKELEELKKQREKKNTEK